MFARSRSNWNLWSDGLGRRKRWSTKRKNLLEQGKTNKLHPWRRDLTPGHFTGRRQLSVHFCAILAPNEEETLRANGFPFVRTTILDKIKWNIKPPPQIKDEAARRAKTHHFPILDLGGEGGGLGFPFILSKIVASQTGPIIKRIPLLIPTIQPD